MSDVADAQQGRYWPGMAALSLAMLLPSLATSITNVTLPTLAASFNATMAEVQWVVIVYLLAVTTLIVGVGRLGDIVGRSRLLLAGMAVFAVASAGCAVSPSVSVLIAARAVQGVGGAVMMTLTVAMIGDLVPRDRAGSAMGLLGTTSAVGTALGPTLGGALIAAFGWPSVFALLSFMGAIAALLGRALFPADVKTVRRSAEFDLQGLLLLALSLLAFSAVFTVADRLSVLASMALAAVSGLGFAAFFWRQAHAPSPLVQLTLLRDHTLGAGLASLILVSAIMMATLVVGPFYLSGVLVLNAVETGLVMSVGPAIAALTGMPAGRMVDRLGPFPVIIAGLVAVVAGALLLTVLPGQFGVSGYVGSLVVVTAGYALFQAANTTAVMQTATGDLRGVTSALLGLSRNLGFITGASAMGALYASGSGIAGVLGIAASKEAGLQATFGIAALLAGGALGASLWGRRRG